ncbi:hypothetical protein LTR28_007879, partial [Elasticomyces elasticus]
DVVPLPLDTVYVALDGEALKRLEKVHGQYGGGFGSPQTNGKRLNGAADKSKSIVTAHSFSPDGQLKQTVHDALRAVLVVHATDVLPLALPAHPITHAPAPPAKVLACEPVSQGLILPSTRIVVVQVGKESLAARGAPAVSSRQSNDYGNEDDDASNDTFYSAAEERSASQAQSPIEESEELSDGADFETSSADNDDLSEDSEDMISLSGPDLPGQASVLMSALESATPQLGSMQMNGISTPGSVYSTLTTNTARGPQYSRSKVFKTHGLLGRLPDELLYPRPYPEDDGEARVYVETAALARLGCFSGDWVKVEADEDQQLDGLHRFGLGSSNDHVNTRPWRPVKVYGLPESMTKKSARHSLKDTRDRRSSISSVHLNTSTSATAHLSPILLANLGEPGHLRLSPLFPRTKSALPRGLQSKTENNGASSPPIAKVVTLLKVSTPLSTERALQPSLFTGLKDYFEQKQRIVKSGDLIGIPIDETLGRTMFEGGAADEESGNNDLLAYWNADVAAQERGTAQPTMTGVAWFRVGEVTISSTDGGQEGDDTDVWGGVATLDPTRTRMGQSGTQQSKVPPAITNAWQYYTGIKKTPPTTGTSVLPEVPTPYVSRLRRRLRELISAATSPRAIHLGLPPVAILLTSNQRNIGKATVASHACSDLGLHFFPIDAYDVLSEGGAGGDVKTEGFLKARAERALTCGAQYTAILVRHIEALNADRMAAALKEILADSRVFLATTTEVDKIPDNIRGLFTHELEMSAPDEGEREGVLRGIVQDCGARLDSSVALSSVAIKTAALVAGDLVDVVDRALVARSLRLETLAASASTATGEAVTVKDIRLSGGGAALSLTSADFATAVEAARKNFADAIGAPKIPSVLWSDVGGLSHVKDAVMETIQLPLSRPELFAKGLKKRSGILFYGPPGTGKTLLAKAIATEFSLNFFSVKGPELLNMYIGESEANVRRVFQRARDARPCVVFFDELDSVAPKRGNQGDSGGVMDRIVSQLLAELDGMSGGGGDEGGGGGGDEGGGGGGGGGGVF